MQSDTFHGIIQDQTSHTLEALVQNLKIICEEGSFCGVHVWGLVMRKQGASVMSIRERVGP